MSIAPRPAKWKSHSTDWSGQPPRFGHRQSTSLGGRTSSVPHDGHRLGIFHGRAFFGRLDTTGPTISGITSPARRTITVSPLRTSLRLVSDSLWSVAYVIVTPPTTTGSRTANGVIFPVRPVWTSIDFSSAVRSSGGNLYAIAQRGAWLVAPRRRWNLASSTFTTAPSISY